MSPRPENYPIPEHWSENRKDVHKMIKEFRDHLTAEKYEPPTETEGVVVLSAPPEKRDNELIEKTSENIARIEYGIEMIKQIVARKSEKPIEEITNEDIIEYAPPLILNCGTEQLPAMSEMAAEAGFPKEKIQLVNCGDRGAGNTKTQFQIMDQDPAYQSAKHLTYITTSYHTPRVVRTAEKNLNRNINFEVIGVPFGNFQYNVYRKVKGEVNKIFDYSEKGDMNRFIKEPATPLIEFDKKIEGIEINHKNEEVRLPEQVVKLRQQLEQTLQQKKDVGEAVPYNGELANVKHFEFKDGKIILNTSKTDYFSYMSSSFIYRNNPQENPIQPLAASATLVTPEGEIIFEERTSATTEMKGRFGIFGGSLKPGENPEEAIRNILKRKIGIDILPEAIDISGADRENINNIAEIFFVVRLQPGQTEIVKEILQKKEAVNKLQTISAKKDLGEIEEMFQKKDITDWNPSSFYNVMYALAKLRLRTPKEVKNIVELMEEKVTRRKPFRYIYPIENYL